MQHTPGDPGHDVGQRGPLERLLGVVSEVRAGEAPTALLLTLNVFLLLTAYYFIKPVREALILAGDAVDIFGWSVGKAELKSYASAGMAALLVLVVRYWGKLASAVSREKLITFATLFFISNLLLFYALAMTVSGPWLGLAFFLWVGIFNVMVVAQFWSFANDVYSEEEGKRLFPIVAFGASAGAVAGSGIAGLLIRRLGVEPMLPAAAVVLTVCIGLTLVVHRRERARRGAEDASPPPASKHGEMIATGHERLGREGGFQLVARDRYLLLIALLILVANLVNTTGEFILGSKVAEAAAEAVRSGEAHGERQFIGEFYSDFFSFVNGAGLLLQLVFVSRILKYLGVKVALLMLPLIALSGYLVLAFGAALVAVRAVKILENSTDYSLQNTVRNVLFLPTSRVAKYKAKAVIDTFFLRIGDFGSALLVLVGSLLALGIEGFALVNVALVVVWIVIAVAIGRRYGARASARRAETS